MGVIVVIAVVTGVPVVEGVEVVVICVGTIVVVTTSSLSFSLLS